MKTTIRPRAPNFAHAGAITALLCTAAAASELQRPEKSPAPLPAELDVKTPAPSPPPKSGAADAPVARPSATTTTSTAPSTRAALPATRAAFDFSTPIFDEPGDGSLWVRGAGYKARFGSDATEVVPFLGSRAPRNFPVALTLRSITAGGDELAFEPGVAPERDAARVTFDRGSVREIYDVAGAAIEQSFEFDALPSGDVALEIGFATDLAPVQTPAGLTFTNALGGVRYGKAFLVDADGDRTELAMELESGAIHIDVSADVLATADFPIVIDPVITYLTVDGDGGDDYFPDPAYESGSSTYLVTYEFAFSSTDHDVYAQLFPEGSSTPSLRIFDATTTSWSAPRVASKRIGTAYLVVAEVGAAGTQEVEGRILNASTNVFTAQFPISVGIGYEHDPDVGGDPAAVGPTYFFVVWERDDSSLDHDIHGRLVNADGTLAGSTIYLSNSSSTIDTNPSVSRSDGVVTNGDYTTQAWSVVFQRTFSSTDQDLYAARVRWDGAIVQPVLAVTTSTLNDTLADASSPTDDLGGVRRYAIVFQRDVTSTDRDIDFFLFEGATLIAARDLSDTVGDNGNQANPAVDCDGIQFSTVYTETETGGPLPNTDVYLENWTNDTTDLDAAETRVSLATGGSLQGSASIFSVHNGGAGPGRSIVAYTSRNLILDDNNVLAAIYDSPIGLASVPFCPGLASTCPCGNAGGGGNGCANSVNALGAGLGGGGWTSVEYDSLSLVAHGMPASATCLYFQGTSSLNSGNGFTFGDGLRCVGGTVIRLGTKTNSGGTSQYPGPGDPKVHVRGLVPAIGGPRYYQAWYRNAASFCTTSTFNLTNGLLVQWTL